MRSLPLLAIRTPDAIHGRAVDGAGAVLLGTTIGWTIVVSTVSGVDPWPVVALLVTIASILGASRAAARLGGPTVIPWIVLGGVGVFAATTIGGPGTATPDLLRGYPNALAALYAQAAVAGLMVAAASRRTAARAVGAVAAIAAAIAPFALASLAAAILILVVPAGILGLRVWRGWRIAIAAAAGLTVAAVVATSALGTVYPHDATVAAEQLAGQSLSQRRLALWHDALRIIADHPVTGIGPGRFAVESPVARLDLSTRWAHEEFLQFGAETGVVGLILMILLFLWGFLRIGVVPFPGPIPALGVTSLTILGVHASMDYVLHFWAIPVVAAVLVGSAIGTGERIHRVPPREGPSA